MAGAGARQPNSRGSAVLFLFVVLAGAGAVTFSPTRSGPACLGYMLVPAITFLFVCWLKGEPPRRRWGEKD